MIKSEFIDELRIILYTKYVAYFQEVYRCLILEM